ncbi:MAG: tetratricopeptide repeat protein [Sphingobacteriales bacterium]|nr:MAG: tetratricopeptide repeat protein [Sphingobacteriales bacterium]
MNNNINFTEEELDLADQYLSGQMSVEERIAFEQRLQNDSDWAVKFKEIQIMALGIQEASLRNEMQQWSQQKKAARVRSINGIKKIAAAAAILLSVSVLGWMLIFKKSGTEQLYADFYKPDPGLATKMSLSDNYEFERAMVDYKTGDYKAALERWNKLLPLEPANDTLHYFIATANLGVDNTAAALQFFNKVLQQNNSAFAGEAYWYKGLALLKQGKKAEAVTAIEQSTHPQKSALLQKLKN